MWEPSKRNRKGSYEILRYFRWMKDVKEGALIRVIRFWREGEDMYENESKKHNVGNSWELKLME